jgi:hypothetical protein
MGSGAGIAAVDRRADRRVPAVRGSSWQKKRTSTPPRLLAWRGRPPFLALTSVNRLPSRPRAYGRKRRKLRKFGVSNAVSQAGFFGFFVAIKARARTRGHPPQKQTGGCLEGRGARPLAAGLEVPGAVPPAFQEPGDLGWHSSARFSAHSSAHGSGSAHSRSVSRSPEPASSWA